MNGKGSPGPRSAAAPPAATPAEGRTRWEESGWRRALQLALAALWLLDAVQQYQTFMFSQGFPKMLAATAAGNPGPLADPVTWSAHLIGTHPGAATAAFGILQLLLALGIAWQPAAYWPISPTAESARSPAGNWGRPHRSRSHSRWQGWADDTAAPGGRGDATERRVPGSRADRAADPDHRTGARSLA